MSSPNIESDEEFTELLGAPVPSFAATVPAHLKPVSLRAQLNKTIVGNVEVRSASNNSPTNNNAAAAATTTTTTTTSTSHQHTVDSLEAPPTPINPNESSLFDWRADSTPQTPTAANGLTNSTRSRSQSSTSARRERMQNSKRFMACEQAQRGHLLDAKIVTGCIMCGYSRFDLQLLNMSTLAKRITEWVNSQIAQYKFASIFISLQHISEDLVEYALQNGIILQKMTYQDWLDHYLIHENNPLVSLMSQIQTSELMLPKIERGIVLEPDGPSTGEIIDNERYEIYRKATEHLMRLRNSLQKQIYEWIKNGRLAVSSLESISLPNIANLQNDGFIG